MSIKNYINAENSNIDFKESVEYTRPKSWLKSVSAFANSNGGSLLFGVSDSQELVGLKDIAKDSEKISELINSRINPLPRYELNTFKEDAKDFIELKIGDGPKTPYYYDADGRKEAFVRAGNQSIPAPKHILDNLIIKGQNTTFDELPSKYDENDISFTLLNATLKQETGKELNLNKDLVSFNLITSDNKVTNAGLLLSDQGLFPQSRIFCTRWVGVVKGSLLGDAKNDNEFEGSIISLLKNAETFITNNSQKSWSIIGMKRLEMPDYPIETVREALVNAIIHRDYQIVGSEIHVDIFDDRLEITSPGGMMDGSFIQNLDITKVSSMRRNRIISDIFSRLHFMERRGSGLTRIVESYSDCEKKPQFISDSSTFKVIFPNKNYFNNNKIKEVSFEGKNIVSDEDYFIIKLYKKLPDKVSKITYNQIIKVFDEYKFISTFKRDNIEKLLNIKKSRASDILSILLEYDIIESAGSTLYKFKK